MSVPIMGVRTKHRSAFPKRSRDYALGRHDGSEAGSPGDRGTRHWCP